MGQQELRLGQELYDEYITPGVPMFYRLPRLSHEMLPMSWYEVKVSFSALYSAEFDIQLIRAGKRRRRRLNTHRLVVHSGRDPGLWMVDGAQVKDVLLKVCVDGVFGLWTCIFIFLITSID